MANFAKSFIALVLAAFVNFAALAAEQDAMIYNPNDQAAQPEVSTKAAKPKSLGNKAIVLQQKLKGDKTKDKKAAVKTPDEKVPAAAATAPKEEKADDAADVNADADADVYGDE